MLGTFALQKYRLAAASDKRVGTMGKPLQKDHFIKAVLAAAYEDLVAVEHADCHTQEISKFLIDLSQTFCISDDKRCR